MSLQAWVNGNCTGFPRTSGRDNVTLTALIENGRRLTAKRTAKMGCMSAVVGITVGGLLNENLGVPGSHPSQ